MLSIPITIRGVLDLTRGLSMSMNNYFAGDHGLKHLIIYDFVLYTLGLMVPLISQSFSLIFGYIRNKKKRSKAVHSD
jgi:uncharacterized membrane protein